MQEIITTTEQQTKDSAKKVLEQLDTTVLLLQGDLGSGKTTFVKGLAQQLGVEEVVTSPTFIIINVHDTHHERFKRLVHVDLYRLEAVQEKDLRELGLLEFIDDPESLVVIEWPERMELAKLDAQRMQFELEGEQRLLRFDDSAKSL